MSNVLTGFAIVGIVIAVGYIVGRLGILGEKALPVFSSFIFFVSLPALMFHAVVTADIATVFGPTSLISFISTVGVMMLFVVVALIFRWGVRDAVIGAMSSGYVNSSNLGIPLAAYILGSAAYMTPIMLYQLAVITPCAMLILDLTDPLRPRTQIWHRLLAPLKNPVTITSFLAIGLSAAGVTVPTVVLEPVGILAAATVPLMLVSFGMSFAAPKTVWLRGSVVPSVVAIALKSVVHPVLAFCLATFVFDLSSSGVFVVVVCAALPMGQNIFIYALRYDVAVSTARRVLTVTTIVSIPILLVASALLA